MNGKKEGLTAIGSEHGSHPERSSSIRTETDAAISSTTTKIPTCRRYASGPCKELEGALRDQFSRAGVRVSVTVRWSSSPLTLSCETQEPHRKTKYIMAGSRWRTATLPTLDVLLKPWDTLESLNLERGDIAEARVEAVMLETLGIHMKWRLLYCLCVKGTWYEIDPPLWGAARYGTLLPIKGESLRKETQMERPMSAMTHERIRKLIELGVFDPEEDQAKIDDFARFDAEITKAHVQTSDLITAELINDILNRLESLERHLSPVSDISGLKRKRIVTGDNAQ